MASLLTPDAILRADERRGKVRRNLFRLAIS
jgi:hypothetical protein